MLERFVRRASALLLCAATASFSAACRTRESKGNPRVSGQIEATEVQVSPEIGGRILDVAVAEGNRLKKGDVVARLDTRDIDLAIQRAQADRAGADAQLRLVQAGSRVEDIRQADAQAAAAAAEVAAAQANLAAAETDLRRFETLLESNSGSRKQRDDAATRRDVARDRLASARARENAAREATAKLRAGARREEGVAVAGQRLVPGQRLPFGAHAPHRAREAVGIMVDVDQRNRLGADVAAAEGILRVQQIA